jgi:hypothetical protein
MQYKEIRKHITYLEIQRMHYAPFKYIKKFVKNTDDILFKEKYNKIYFF